MVDPGTLIEARNKAIRLKKEERERKNKLKLKSIKLSPVRNKMENTDKYRRGGRESIHSKIFRGLDENEKKKARERRSIELKKEKIREEKEEIKRNNKGRIKRVLISDELSDEYKKLILEGLTIINDLMIRVGNDFRDEEVNKYLNRVERILLKGVK